MWMLQRLHLMVPHWCACDFLRNKKFWWYHGNLMSFMGHAQSLTPGFNWVRVVISFGSFFQLMSPVLVILISTDCDIFYCSLWLVCTFDDLQIPPPPFDFHPRYYYKTSVDTGMCCPKGKCGCQYFILLTLKKKIHGHRGHGFFLIKN